ncbi:MAG: transcriptional repressor LexA [Chloroflexi bacterium]|nr:transcriptional repressor LexA [Chloroflexota bacterium]
MPGATGLSTRQQRILTFIRDFQNEHSYPPTVREIGQAVEISSTSVVDYHLKALFRAGYLHRDPDVSRGLSLVESEERPCVLDRATMRVPVVGTIAAGEPIAAVESHAETIELTGDLATEDCYALRVKGKSMIGDLIDDGDVVVVRPQATADNGAIVVALLTDGPGGEGQATLKRIFRERDCIRLQPANGEMEPIYARPSDVMVQGRVVAVIRKL